MTSRTPLVSVLGVGLFIALAACGNGAPRSAALSDGGQAGDDAAAAPSIETGAAWRSAVLLDTGSKLSGVAVGDVLPDVPGNEIVAVGTDHSMHLLWRDGERWRHEVIATTPGEMIQVDVGDVDPERPGDEIVAVGVVSGGEDDPGARGAAVYVTHEGSEWTVQQVFEDAALLHGVCIQGPDVWVAGYGNQVHLLGHVGSVPWPAHSAPLPGPGRSIAATEHGVAVACRDGSVVEVALSGVAGPVPRTSDRRQVGRARIGAADGALLVSDDDGTLTLLAAEDGGTRARTELHRNPDKLRGAVLADLDPSAPGLEAATAGYDGTIRVFTRLGAVWREDVVARDSDRFHHLTSGALPGWPGTVLVGVNYSGKVTVAGRVTVAGGDD